MYPSPIDQSRQDNVHPQTVHVHMHQFCPCVHPYYTSYRPPILASPFPVQPLTRPYNLQHYQYTQFNLSPYNLQQSQPQQAQQAQQQPSTSTSQQNQHQQQSASTSSTILDFGAATRDCRRMYENLDTSTGGNHEDSSCKDTFFEDFLAMPSQQQQQQLNLNESLHCANLALADGSLQAFCLSTENFTKYLEQGCILAEKIAIRNQHRPCFKNIQNLCNRTRSEILKPSNTVSNIHSQGMPWATKDFIYAYVRLINCWHMLKGYLDSKDGTLGNIDKELTPEFKTCYLSWEKETKELAAHMIRIFSNLDNNVSNPNPGCSYLMRNKTFAQTASSSNLNAAVIPQQIQQQQQQPQPAVVEKDMNLKSSRGGGGGGGILHIPSTSSCDNVNENNDNFEASPNKDEDSDDGSRVYMKPGSYSVPKKNSSPENSTPSIEFFDTAQNVSAHYKKLGAYKKKADHSHTGSNTGAGTDKLWKDAQSAIPFLLNKINPTCQEAQKDEKDVQTLQYFIELDSMHHQGSDSNIQEWLNNNNFHEADDGINESPLNLIDGYISSKPITVLKRSQCAVSNGNSFQNDSGNKSGNKDRSSNRKLHGNQKKAALNVLENVSNIWELEKGGLTPNAIVMLEKVIRNLEQERVFKNQGAAKYGKEDGSDGEKRSVQLILKKLTSRKYQYLSEVIHDIKAMLIRSEQQQLENHSELREKCASFEKKLDESLSNLFPNVDFSSITGDRNEDLGPIMLKGKSDGDGDHK